MNNVEQGSDANTCSLHTLEINWNSCTEDDFLNSDISPKEVTEAIHRLKANTAAGPDGIIPEVYKHAGDKIIPFLVHLFNTVFTSCRHSEAWTEAIILPLYKKGSICLLYTSDAADEVDRVDLGGRRIIKKKIF